MLSVARWSLWDFRHSLPLFYFKVEKHLRNVNALPAALPNIDFAAYNKVRLQRVLSGQTLHIL